MATTFITGFDAQDVRIDGFTLAANGSFDTTIKRTGAASLKIVATSGVNGQSTLNISTVKWYRFYVRVTALPATTRRNFFGQNSSANLRLNPDGTIAYWNSTSIGTSTTALTDTTKFYCIEVRSADGTSVELLRIDGVDQGVIGSPSSWSMLPNCGPNDTVADTYTIYIDDVICDNAAFPGQGAAALLLPVSDNARGAKWFAGTAGTTNLWDAVDNLPPIGKLSPQTTTSAITHAGGGVNPEDYDANMTSYSTAGVPAGATVNAVQGVIVHGEDIATGTKLLTFSVKSNPAQGAYETNFSAGGDVGAVGTYPTNWSATRGAIVSGAGVTLGTSPVLSVRRPETASRLADVCFMGLYVDYTPAVSIATPGPVMSKAAVHRAANW